MVAVAIMMGLIQVDFFLFSPPFSLSEKPPPKNEQLFVVAQGEAVVLLLRVSSCSICRRQVAGRESRFKSHGGISLRVSYTTTQARGEEIISKSTPVISRVVPICRRLDRSHLEGKGRGFFFPPSETEHGRQKAQDLKGSP